MDVLLQSSLLCEVGSEVDTLVKALLDLFAEESDYLAFLSNRTLETDAKTEVDAVSILVHVLIA